MTKILYSKPDQTLAIASPADGTVTQSFIDRRVPVGVSYSVVENSEIPTDLTYWKSWRLSNNTITYDMGVVKEIAVNNVKKTAVKALEEANECALLNEASTYSVANIQAAYADVKTQIQGSSEIATITSLVNTFVSTYGGGDAWVS